MIKYNGIILTPHACVVKEEACGQYEVELTHPLDERVRGITFDALISVPVPAQESPAIRMRGHAGHEIRKVTAADGAGLYVRPSTGTWEIKHLQQGEEYEQLLGVDATWHEAVTKEGMTGYIQTARTAFVRSEPAGDWSSVVRPLKTRWQLFRVYATELDTTASTLVIRGRHVSYDAAGHILNHTAIFETAPVEYTLNHIKNNVIGHHDIALRTDRTDRVTGDYRLKNIMQALLDPEEGIAYKTRAKVLRENLDFFVLDNPVIDRGVVIAHGKNLLGVQYHIDASTRVKRVIPVGRDAEGNAILLPEGYIDTTNHPGTPWTAATIEVGEAKVGDGMTLEQAYAKMREAAQDELARGADLASVSLEVDFVALGDTEEYAQYRELERLHLYDRVTIKDDMHGILAAAQVRAYEWDCLTEHYIKISLGDVHSVQTGGVAGYELPTGGVAGYKLVQGSVGAPQLGQGSVSREKMTDAVLLSLKTDALDAVQGRIRELVSESITTDQLYADIAEIAEIRAGSMDIDFARIKDVRSGTVIFREGEGGRLTVDRLVVTEGNMANLTVGSLAVFGADGRLYVVSVDEDGSVTATPRELHIPEIEQLQTQVRILNDADLQSSNYIRTGLIYYDGGTPRFGVAIGENLTTTIENGQEAVKREGLAATFTSDRLSFWQNAREVAYFSNNQLHTTRIEVQETIKQGNWETVVSPMWALKWAGD